MCSNTHKLKLKVWQWPNPRSRDGGWHFVTLPKDISKEIRDKYGKGMHKAEVRVEKSEYRASLFWHTIDQAYIVAIKKMIREKEGIFKGDLIKISFKLV